MTYYMDSPAKSGDGTETPKYTSASKCLSVLFLCPIFFDGLCRGAQALRSFSCVGCFRSVRPVANYTDNNGGGSHKQHEEPTMSNDVPLHLRLNRVQIQALTPVLQKLSAFDPEHFALHFTDDNTTQAQHAISGATSLLSAIDAVTNMMPSSMSARN